MQESVALICRSQNFRVAGISIVARYFLRHKFPSRVEWSVNSLLTPVKCSHSDCYRPQRSCEGYIFTGVCLSTGGGSLLPGVPGPGGCLLQGGVCSQGGCLVPGGCLLRGGAWSGGRVGIPACTEADTPPGETATAADGTHPTGMHSCLVFSMIQRNYFNDDKFFMKKDSELHTPFIGEITDISLNSHLGLAQYCPSNYMW